MIVSFKERHVSFSHEVPRYRRRVRPQVLGLRMVVGSRVKEFTESTDTFGYVVGIFSTLEGIESHEGEEKVHH